ncbi:MAG: DUF1998 domain-containing protein [Byssovorax sp.]
MSLIKIRQGQIVSTYGPGSLVDLPDTAVLVAGLEHWSGDAELVPEPRLLANLRRRLKLPMLDLRAPPVPQREDDLGVGIVACQFPEWFVAQFEIVTKEYGRSRPLLHRRNLVKGRYRADDPTGKRKRNDWPVVPFRFVQACPNGHVSDINWSALLHGEGHRCSGSLWFDERGTTGDLADLYLRCDGPCKTRAISFQQLGPVSEERSLLGDCRGERLWLGPAAREACLGKEGKPHRNKLLIRHASNAYFPLIERAISIPDHDDRVRKAVDAIWDDFLSVAESAADVKRERKKQRVSQALDGLSDAEVWAECERRQRGDAGEQKSLKDVEQNTFLASTEELGHDKPEGDFYARRLRRASAAKGPFAAIERVVLVHRLREVVTQYGFTRFESPIVAIDSEADLGVGVAALAMDTRWLPAVENRGEGVFLALKPDLVQQWTTYDAVKKRAREFLSGLQGTSSQPLTLERALKIHMPYVMLHSLSHLLLTTIALECGYAAASIRERIYVREGAYGILLYTASGDAEGTLGGLVQVGRKMERHLLAALELGRLCSNDPVCAQHDPSHRHESRGAHGAACHGCLLIAEPCCERRNELLDRSLVVPTVAVGDAAFFSEDP